MKEAHSEGDKVRRWAEGAEGGAEGAEGGTEGAEVMDGGSRREIDRGSRGEERKGQMEKWKDRDGESRREEREGERKKAH